MPGLPTGTVTFLFTDLEGSTRLHRVDGDYAEVLEVTRRSFAAHWQRTTGGGGYAGRPFFPAFASAPRSGGSRGGDPAWAAGALTRVRIGLHTGEAELRRRPARRHRRASGGAHLRRPPTAARCSCPSRRATSAGGRRARDLGEHRLKHLLAPAAPVPARRSRAARRIPPPQTLHRLPDALPVQATPLVGRARELEAARRRSSRAGGQPPAYADRSGRKRARRRWRCSLQPTCWSRSTTASLFVDLSSRCGDAGPRAAGDRAGGRVARGARRARSTSAWLSSSPSGGRSS